LVKLERGKRKATERFHRGTIAKERGGRKKELWGGFSGRKNKAFGDSEWGDKNKGKTGGLGRK